MDDLISRWAAIDALTDTNLKRNVDSVCDGDMNRAKRAAQRVIAQLPAVDAAPVVHAQWRSIKAVGGPSYPYWDAKCSECGYTTKSTAGWLYCPHCGAKMDGDA